MYKFYYIGMNVAVIRGQKYLGNFSDISEPKELKIGIRRYILSIWTLNLFLIKT